MEIIFNLSKVKYVKMDELFNDKNIILKEQQGVNLFINLEVILRKLTSGNIEEYLRVKKKERVLELIANVVNICAHYRSYFFKRGIQSRIYVYMSYPFTEEFKNSVFVDEYRSYYVNAFGHNPKHVALNDILTDAIPLMEIIFNYIDDVYFIKDNHIEISLVPEIINEINTDKFLNIILTKDPYEFQYVNKDYLILYPDKENSMIIDKNNLISFLYRDKENTFDFSSSFITFILSIVGDKYRSIPKLKGYGTVTIGKLIKKGLELEIISQNISNIHLLLNMIKPEYHEKILNNYFATDIDSQFKLLSTKDKMDITYQLVNRFDNVSLKDLNDKYFQMYPLYLIELNNFKKKKHKKIIF